MSDMLVIVEPTDSEQQLIDELGWRHPDRVTVLLQDGGKDWATDESPRGVARRNRLAEVLHAIETRTGAAVIGLAGDAEQLRGWRFDRVVRAPQLRRAA